MSNKEFEATDFPYASQIVLGVALIATGLFFFLFTTELPVTHLAGYGFLPFTIATFAWFRYLRQRQRRIEK
jgi:hypothetical protein